MEGSIIPAGTVTRLLCVSTGGNPLATLTWFKNDKKINAVLKTGDKMVSAELSIMANVTDNQARYRCEAQNSATEIPMFESKTLSVHCEYTAGICWGTSITRRIAIHFMEC